MSFDRTIEVLESIENSQVEVLIKEIWDYNSTVIWNSGIKGEETSIAQKSFMLEFLQRLTEKALKRITNFDYIIRLNIPSIVNNCHDSLDPLKRVLDTPHLMDASNSKLRKLKTKLEEEAYYTYNPVNFEKEIELIEQIKVEIYQTLKGRRYLLVTEELNVDLTDRRVSWLLECWLSGSRFGSNRALNDDSWWLITGRYRTSRYINPGRLVLDLSDLVDRYDQLFSPVFLLEQELCLAAKSISSKYCMELRRSMDTLGSCMLYSVLLEPEGHYEPKELIRMWIAEGLLSRDIKLKTCWERILSRGIECANQFR